MRVLFAVGEIYASQEASRGNYTLSEKGRWKYNIIFIEEGSTKSKIRTNFFASSIGSLRYLISLSAEVVTKVRCGFCNWRLIQQILYWLTGPGTRKKGELNQSQRESVELAK